MGSENTPAALGCHANVLFVPALILELVEGETLRERLEDAGRESSSLRAPAPSPNARSLWKCPDWRVFIDVFAHFTELPRFDRRFRLV